jgi:hypothetical protein
MPKGKPVAVRVAITTGVFGVVLAVIGFFSNWFTTGKKDSPKSPSPQNNITVTGSNNAIQQSSGPLSPNIQASNVSLQNSSVTGQTVSVYNGPVNMYVNVSPDAIKASGIKVPLPTGPQESPTKAQQPPAAQSPQQTWHTIERYERNTPGWNPIRQAIANINGKMVVLVPITLPEGIEKTRLTDNIDFTRVWPKQNQVRLRVFVSNVPTNQNAASITFKEKQDKPMAQDPDTSGPLVSGGKFNMTPGVNRYYSKLSGTVKRGQMLVFVEDGISIDEVNSLPGVFIR